MTGSRFDPDGDMWKIMQDSQAAVGMTKLASEIDTEFGF